MTDQHNEQPENNRPGGNVTRSFALLLCMGALAGVLIWAKLRLVTDIPRSAYADPREEQVDDTEQASDQFSDDEQRKARSHETHP